MSYLLFRFHHYCQIHIESLWLRVKNKDCKSKVTSHSWIRDLAVEYFSLSIGRENPTSFLLATFVRSNLFREQLNILLLQNVGTKYIPGHKAIYYAIFPVPLAKSQAKSQSTTEKAAFQLGSMAGGQSKSAFPFPDSILKLTVQLNILLQPGG